MYCFNLLRLHTFIGMHIQKIKYHIFSWPYFKAFLGNNHHILHFETTIFIVCRSHLPLLGHPSSIKCKKSIIYLTSFVRYFFFVLYFYLPSPASLICICLYNANICKIIDYLHQKWCHTSSSIQISLVCQISDKICIDDKAMALVEVAYS